MAIRRSWTLVLWNWKSPFEKRVARVAAGVEIAIAKVVVVDVFVEAEVAALRGAVADHGLGNDLEGAAKSRIIVDGAAVVARLQTTKRFLAKISSSKFLIRRRRKHLHLERAIGFGVLRATSKRYLWRWVLARLALDPKPRLQIARVANEIEIVTVSEIASVKSVANRLQRRHNLLSNSLRYKSSRQFMEMSPVLKKRHQLPRVVNPR